MTDTDSMVVRHAPRAAAQKRPPAGWAGDLALILPPFALLFGAILSFGAAEAEPALFCAALQCAWACALALYYLFAAKPLRVSGLQMSAALLFVVLLAWTLFTLTPFAPFGVAEAWRLTGAPGALTMDRAATLTEFFKLCGLGAMFFAGLAIAQAERRADRALNILLWAGTAYALWAVGSFAQHPTFTMGHQKLYHLDRLTGSFLSANSAGSLFGLLAVTAWITALRSVRAVLRQGEVDLRRPSRLLSEAALRFGMSILFWVALLFTVSRAATVATGFCILLVTLLEVAEALSRRRAASGKIIGYTAPLALGMVVLFAATVGQRFVGQFSALATDQATRIAIFDTYLRAIGEAPISGVGLGSFRALNATLIDGSNFQVLWNLGAAHNIYLQWLLEGGVIGLGLATATIGLVLVDIARRRVTAETGKTRATIALAVSAVLLLHNTVDYSIQIPAIAALWSLLLGLGAGISARGARRPSFGGESPRRDTRPASDEPSTEIA